MASTVSSTSFGYAITVPAAGTIISTPVRIKSIILHPNSAGDRCVITDIDDNRVASLIASTTNSSESIDLYESQYNGLKFSSVVSTLCSLSILIV